MSDTPAEIAAAKFADGVLRDFVDGVLGEIEGKLAWQSERIRELEQSLEAHINQNYRDTAVVCDGLNRERNRAEKAEQSNKELLDVLQKLADKIDLMEKPINNCIAISIIHGIPYSGPNWTQELTAARAAITKYGDK